MSDFPLSCYSGKNVLITGDTGFKGSWLAIWLLKLGACITGFGLPPKTRDDNFTVCNLASRIDHIDGDIRDFNTISEVIQDSKPDYVFHLAAQALVLDSYADPFQTFTTNVTGTLNVLEALRKNPGTQAAVFVTSDKCYENQERISGYRESDPLGGRDPYSASKGAAEIVISSYTRSFFQDECTPAVASVRAGNVIGGGDWSKNRIVPDCMRSLMSNNPIEIRNPQAIRPWQHVLEPLYGYLLLGSALSDSGGKSFSGPWNFGPYPSHLVTVETLVDEIICQWGEGAYHIAGTEQTQQEAGTLLLDINKAINSLGWRPVLSLEHAIRFTLDEYRAGNLSGDEVYQQRSDNIDEYQSLQKPKV